MKNILGRKDAKKIKNISGLSQICIDLKPNRCNSDVYINQKLDVTNLVKYMDNHKEDQDKISYFHVFATALGKLIYNRPKLNRFVANRHIYEHNEIILSFIAKFSFNDDSEEMMVMIPIGDNDNLFSISKKISEKVNSIRRDSIKKKGANKAIDFLGKLPNIVRIPILGIFKWCDKKGILPKTLIKDNLYYSSMIVSNLGSIKCGAIYHNITNFGTCSSLTTIGEIKKEEVINESRKKKIRSVCEFGINIDERIADGYYFAKSFNLFQYILNNPELLEQEMSKKIDLNEIR